MYPKLPSMSTLLANSKGAQKNFLHLDNLIQESFKDR